MKSIVCFVVALCCLCTGVTAAQDGLAAENRNPITRLDNITAVACTFITSSLVQWPKDAPPSIRTRAVGGPVLNVRVQKIDAPGGSGEIVAPTRADALVQQYGWNIHIMEASRAGQMRLLTIFGRESAMGKLKAVYTRTDYLPVDLPGFITEPEATQYYGECEITR